MKIIKFDLRRLRNEEHFQLMRDFKQLVEQAGINTLNIDQLFAVFVVLLGKEDLAIEIIRKSGLTNPIFNADKHRDAIYHGFVLLIESCLHSPNDAKVQAAQNIRVVIDHYGDFRNKTYNEETASIYNFLQDINSRCMGDIETLNAGEWITGLAEANQAFDELMNQRFDEKAAQEYINLREVRNEIDKIYTQIIDRINASILLNGEAVYADFVNKLNERLTYFKNTLAQRKGRAEKTAL
jgi:hypothetical protein